MEVAKGRVFLVHGEESGALDRDVKGGALCRRRSGHGVVVGLSLVRVS